MRQVTATIPSKQIAAGFWITCGCVAFLLLAGFLYLSSQGHANPHKAYYPLINKAPTEEAKREFRYWSVSGLLHYHYERQCHELIKLDDKFVGSSTYLGNPKRQEFGGYEMDPCPLCVSRKQITSH